MRQFLIRFIALILIPALQVDSALAAAIAQRSVSPPTFFYASLPPHCDDQALVAAALWTRNGFHRVQGARVRCAAGGVAVGLILLPELNHLSEGRLALDQILQILRNPHAIGLIPIIGMAFSRRGFLDAFIPKNKREEFPIVQPSVPSREDPAPHIPEWMLRALRLSPDGHWTPQALDNLQQYLRNNPDTIIRDLRFILSRAPKTQLEDAWHMVGAYYPAQNNFVTNFESLIDVRRTRDVPRILAWHLAQALSPALNPKGMEVPTVLQDNPLLLSRRQANRLLASLLQLRNLPVEAVKRLLTPEELVPGLWLITERAIRLREEFIKRRPSMAPLRNLPMDQWDPILDRVSFGVHIRKVGSNEPPVYRGFPLGMIKSIFRSAEIEGRLLDHAASPLLKLLKPLGGIDSFPKIGPEGTGLPFYYEINRNPVRQIVVDEVSKRFQETFVKVNAEGRIALVTSNLKEPAYSGEEAARVIGEILRISLKQWEEKLLLKKRVLDRSSRSKKKETMPSRQAQWYSQPGGHLVLKNLIQMLQQPTRRLISAIESPFTPYHRNLDTAA